MACRLLILNCDFDENPETNGASLLKKQLCNLCEISVYDVFRNEFPASLNFDRIIITGSRASVYQNDSWIQTLSELLTSLHEIPVLGICFGYQLIAQTFGGKVEPSGMYEEGFSKVTVDDVQHPLFNELPKEFFVYQNHGDIVTQLPRNTIVLARSRDGVQAFVYQDFFGVQFHPEILATTARKMAIRDKKNVEQILHNVPEEYSLPLKVLVNFVHKTGSGENLSSGFVATTPHSCAVSDFD